MKEQYTIIYSWMLDLGLSPSELLAFALIKSYTDFKDSYSGDLSFLAKWAGTSISSIGQILDQLISKGVVTSFCGPYKRMNYKACVCGRIPQRKAAHNNINNINNNMDNNIDNNMDNSIDNNMDDTMDDNMDELESESSLPEPCSEPPVPSRPIPPAPAPAKPAPAKPVRFRPFTPEEIDDIIYPYGTLDKVPYEVLKVKLAALEDRRRREAQRNEDAALMKE